MRESSPALWGNRAFNEILDEALDKVFDKISYPLAPVPCLLLPAYAVGIASRSGLGITRGTNSFAS